MTNEKVAKIVLDEIQSLSKDIRENVEHISRREIDKLHDASNILIKIAESTFLGAVYRDIDNA